jgi:proline dehydrogenase
VPGPAPADAVRACRILQQRGCASTVGFWNIEADRPDRVAAVNRAAITMLSGTELDWVLSVKAPALGFDTDLLGAVMEDTSRANTQLRFDSLGLETADRNLAAAAELASRYPGVGITVPARWARSDRDATIAADARMSVRVVKGQWPDPRIPGDDLGARFLAMIDRLAGSAAHVAVATHDPVLAQQALGRLRAAGTPCELELLFGLPADQPAQMARAMSVPVRVYVPFGTGYLPYRLGEAVRNPSIVWWLVQDALLPRRKHWRRLPSCPP